MDEARERDLHTIMRMIVSKASVLEDPRPESIQGLATQGVELNGLMEAYRSAGGAEANLAFARAVHKRFLRLVESHPPE